METWIRLASAPAVPVVPAVPEEDVGDKVARLDRLTLRRLRLVDGGIVELRARTSTWVRIFGAPTEDDRSGVARIDPDVLADIGAKPGDWVFLRPGVPRTAKHVTLREIVDTSTAEAPGVWNHLEGRTLIVGDVVRVGVTTDETSGRARLAVVGLSLVTVDVRQGHVEPTTARVDATDPDGPVTVASSTTIDLLPRLDGAA